MLILEFAFSFVYLVQITIILDCQRKIPLRSLQMHLIALTIINKGIKSFTNLSISSKRNQYYLLPKQICFANNDADIDFFLQLFMSNSIFARWLRVTMVSFIAMISSNCSYHCQSSLIMFSDITLNIHCQSLMFSNIPLTIDCILKKMLPKWNI